ncbi:MAG: hypothetical protein AAF570_23830, partial [Bacteroidota bacterium]
GKPDFSKTFVYFNSCETAISGSKIQQAVIKSAQARVFVGGVTKLTPSTSVQVTGNYWKKMFSTPTLPMESTFWSTLAAVASEGGTHVSPTQTKAGQRVQTIGKWGYYGDAGAFEAK